MKNTQRLFERTVKELLKSVEDIDYDENELKMGIDVETEHLEDPKDRATAEKIAKHHLAEDPAYYSKLKTIHDEDEEGRNYHHRTISRRAFDLGIKIASKFDLGLATPTYKNGLLIIDVPFAESSKPRTLKIK